MSEGLEFNTKYDEFIYYLNACTEMARTYLKRAVADGKLNEGVTRYIQNLLALQCNPGDNEAVIVCSNTELGDQTEHMTPDDIRFIKIDKDLFNMPDEEFDQAHLDDTLNSLMESLSEENKKQFYELLKSTLEDEKSNSSETEVTETTDTTDDTKTTEETSTDVESTEE
jgi:hypothetical protein